MGLAQLSQKKCAKQLVLSTPSPPHTLMPQHDARDAPSIQAPSNSEVRRVKHPLYDSERQRSNGHQKLYWFQHDCQGAQTRINWFWLFLPSRVSFHIDVIIYINNKTSISGGYDLLTLLSCLLTCLKSAPCNIHAYCLWMTSLHLATHQKQQRRMPSPCRRTWFSSPSTMNTELWKAPRLVTYQNHIFCSGNGLSSYKYKNLRQPIFVYIYISTRT